jgi:hypothetical protein
MSVSADGSYIAAAITDSGFSNKERKYYIGVYDGKNGGELTRFAVSGTDVVYDERGAVPTVFVYDVATGTRLTSAEHEPVTSSAFMNASFESHGVEFSSDGKYPIAATRDTKVWALDAA